VARVHADVVRVGAPLSGLRLGYAVAAAAIVALVVTLVAVLPATAPPRLPRTVAQALGDDPARDRLVQRRSAEAIAVRTADCLRRAGIPAVPVLESDPPVPDADLPPIAWAERWGFGVSTAVDAPVASPQPDPNLVAADQAGPGGRARFLAAFLGRAGQPGCHETASTSVLGLRDRVTAPLHAAFRDLEAEIDADPAMTAVLTAWRACVRPVAPSLADGPRSAVMPALLEAFAARVAALPGSDARLREIQDDERRVATTIARCEVAYAAAREAAAAPHERAFVVAHRAELAEMRGAIEREVAGWPTLPP
jgi:hypothetical protein